MSLIGKLIHTIVILCTLSFMIVLVGCESSENESSFEKNLKLINAEDLTDEVFECLREELDKQLHSELFKLSPMFHDKSLDGDVMIELEKKRRRKVEELCDAEVACLGDSVSRGFVYVRCLDNLEHEHMSGYR